MKKGLVLLCAVFLLSGCKLTPEECKALVEGLYAGAIFMKSDKGDYYEGDPYAFKFFYLDEGKTKFKFIKFDQYGNVVGDIDFGYTSAAFFQQESMNDLRARISELEAENARLLGVIDAFCPLADSQ